MLDAFIFTYYFQDRFNEVDMKVRVNGGGHVAQIYAIRQAISKALVSYYQKCNNKYVIYKLFNIL